MAKPSLADLQAAQRANDARLFPVTWPAYQNARAASETTQAALASQTGALSDATSFFTVNPVSLVRLQQNIHRHEAATRAIRKPVDEAVSARHEIRLADIRARQRKDIFAADVLGYDGELLKLKESIEKTEKAVKENHGYKLSAKKNDYFQTLAESLTFFSPPLLVPTMPAPAAGETQQEGVTRLTAQAESRGEYIASVLTNIKAAVPQTDILKMTPEEFARLFNAHARSRTGADGRPVPAENSVVTIHWGFANDRAFIRKLDAIPALAKRLQNVADAAEKQKIRQDYIIYDIADEDAVVQDLIQEHFRTTQFKAALLQYLTVHPVPNLPAAFGINAICDAAAATVSGTLPIDPGAISNAVQNAAQNAHVVLDAGQLTAIENAARNAAPLATPALAVTAAKPTIDALVALQAMSGLYQTFAHASTYTAAIDTPLQDMMDPVAEGPYQAIKQATVAALGAIAPDDAQVDGQPPTNAELLTASELAHRNNNNGRIQPDKDPTLVKIGTILHTQLAPPNYTIPDRPAALNTNLERANYAIKILSLVNPGQTTDLANKDGIWLREQLYLKSQPPAQIATLLESLNDGTAAAETKREALQDVLYPLPPKPVAVLGQMVSDEANIMYTQRRDAVRRSRAAFAQRPVSVTDLKNCHGKTNLATITTHNNPRYINGLREAVETLNAPDQNLNHVTHLLQYAAHTQKTIKTLQPASTNILDQGGDQQRTKAALTKTIENKLKDPNRAAMLRKQHAYAYRLALNETITAFETNISNKGRTLSAMGSANTPQKRALEKEIAELKAQQDYAVKTLYDLEANAHIAGLQNSLAQRNESLTFSQILERIVGLPIPRNWDRQQLRSAYTIGDTRVIPSLQAVPGASGFLAERSTYYPLNGTNFSKFSAIIDTVITQDDNERDARNKVWTNAVMEADAFIETPDGKKTLKFGFTDPMASILYGDQNMAGLKPLDPIRGTIKLVVFDLPSDFIMMLLLLVPGIVYHFLGHPEYNPFTAPFKESLDIYNYPSKQAYLTTQLRTEVGHAFMLKKLAEIDPDKYFYDTDAEEKFRSKNTIAGTAWTDEENRLKGNYAIALNLAIDAHCRTHNASPADFDSFAAEDKMRIQLRALGMNPDLHKIPAYKSAAEQQPAPGETVESIRARVNRHGR